MTKVKPISFENLPDLSCFFLPVPTSQETNMKTKPYQQALNPIRSGWKVTSSSPLSWGTNQLFFKPLLTDVNLTLKSTYWWFHSLFLGLPHGYKSDPDVKASHCLSCPHWIWRSLFLLEEEYFFSLRQPFTCVPSFPMLFTPLTNMPVYTSSETPFQSPALLNWKVKLFHSPYLLLNFFLLYRSEWRMQEDKLSLSG